MRLKHPNEQPSLFSGPGAVMLAAAVVAFELAACTSSACQTAALTPTVTTSESLFNTYVSSLTTAALLQNNKNWGTVPFNSFTKAAAGSSQSWQIDGMSFGSTAAVLQSYRNINASLTKKYGTFGKYQQTTKLKTTKPTVAQFKLAIRQLHDFYKHTGVFAQMTNLGLTASGLGLLDGEASAGTVNGVNCAQANDVSTGLGALSSIASPPSYLAAAVDAGVTAQQQQEQINNTPITGSCADEGYRQFHGAECGNAGLLDAAHDLAAGVPLPTDDRGVPDPLGLAGLASAGAHLAAEGAGCPAESTGNPTVDGINSAVAGTASSDGSPTGDQSHAPDFTTGGPDPCAVVNGAISDSSNCYLSGPGVP